MTGKNNLLIASASGSNLAYFNKNFSPMAQPEELHGLYAYITYKTQEDQISVLNRFQEYQSNHAGIELYFNTLLNEKHIFSFCPDTQERIRKFYGQKPAYGGEVIFLNGKVMAWNFKSGTFSESKFTYSDFNPGLGNIIKHGGFPESCFMTLSETRNIIYNDFFNQDGTYNNSEINFKKYLLDKAIAKKTQSFFGGFKTELEKYCSNQVNNVNHQQQNTIEPVALYLSQ